MKFIHCADLHFDSKIDSLPREKSKIIREEVVSSFEKMVNEAKEQGVRAIIISGDMFDSANVSVKTKLRLTSIITNARDIDFLYLSGNHDEESEIFSNETLPNNFKIFSDKWAQFVYDNVSISGITFNGVNNKFLYDELKLDENKINIVCMHGQIAGYKSDNNAEIISLPKLKDKYIDYLALGHVHFYEKNQLDERGFYAYSGCLQGRGYDELGEKGYVFIEVENQKLTTSFKPISVYKFYEFEYSVTDKTNFYKCIEEIVLELQSKFDKNSLIKVILTGEHDTNFEIDLETLQNKLNGVFFYSKIYDRTSLKITLKDFENDKSFKGEFVRLVLQSDLDDERKKQVIMTGLNTFKEEI